MQGPNHQPGWPPRAVDPGLKLQLMVAPRHRRCGDGAWCCGDGGPKSARIVLETQHPSSTHHQSPDPFTQKSSPNPYKSREDAWNQHYSHRRPFLSLSLNMFHKTWISAWWPFSPHLRHPSRGAGQDRGLPSHPVHLLDERVDVAFLGTCSKYGHLQSLLHLTHFCCLISLLHVGATSSKNNANVFSNIIHTKTSPLLLGKHPSDQDASELCEKQEQKRALRCKAHKARLGQRLQNPRVLVRRGAWSSSVLGQQHQANTSYRVRWLLTWQGGDAASTLLCEVADVRTANASECLWDTVSNLFHLLVASEMMSTNKAVQFV